MARGARSSPLYVGRFASALTAALIALLACGILGRVASAASEGMQRSQTPAQWIAQIRGLHERVEKMGAASSPKDLSRAAETLGSLVSEARDLELSRADFSKSVEGARALQEVVRTVREAHEKRAGDDEEALAALYRSDDWRRLDFAEVTIGYWLGWALLGEAERIEGAEERAKRLQDAERAFSHASLEIALPRIAGMSLLGLGIVWRHLDEPDRADRALTRFAREVAPDLSPAVRATAHYHLAMLALESGDVERGRSWSERIPKDLLGRDAALDLASAEARARLEAGPTDPEGAASDLDRVAALLRQLSAAGRSHARVAAALAFEHRRRLAGLDVGPAGDLIEAEDAFAEERYADARDAYARALAREEQLGGLDLDPARYKFAYALMKVGGDRQEALSQLEAILDGEAGAFRKRAARLYLVLSEAELAERPGDAAAARARRAARLLLELDSQSPEADRARYRLARSTGVVDPEERARLLEAVPEFSELYPATRIELVRIRAQQLQELEDSGRGKGRRARSAADALAEELEHVRSLIAEGRLEPDAGRDARLAVLRAKAAERTGAPPNRVLALAEEAATRFDLDSRSRGALLRLELRALTSAGRFDELSAKFEAATDSEVRRYWTSWYEAARLIESKSAQRVAPDLRVRLYARLAVLGPEEYRDAIALAEAEAMLSAERAEEAIEKARMLVARDPTWADARIVYARALEAATEFEAAEEEWSRLARGLEQGGDPWLDAQLGLVRTRSAVGDRKGACHALRAARAHRPDLNVEAGEPAANLVGDCEEGSADRDPRGSAGRSGTSPP